MRYEKVAAMKVTIDITPEEVREVEAYLARRVAMQEIGMTNLLLEDIVLARVVSAGLDAMGKE